MRIERITDDITLIKGDGVAVTRKLVRELGNGFADAIITDPPYGCRLDNQKQFNKDIPAFHKDQLWEMTWSSVKEDGAVLMFNEGAGYARLVASGLEWFRYNFVFDSLRNRGHLNCSRMPMLRHGLIGVFYKKLPTYNPQMNDKVFDGNYPNDLLKYIKSDEKNLYPHERNVAVLEFLVKTYTNDGDVVYDFCMGSAPLAVACYNTGRKFIGVELIDETFEKALYRVNNHIKRSSL